MLSAANDDQSTASVVSSSHQTRAKVYNQGFIYVMHAMYECKYVMVEERPVFTLCNIHIMPNILVRVSHATDDTIWTFMSKNK